MKEQATEKSRKRPAPWPLLPVISLAIVFTGLFLYALGLLFVWLERGTVFVTLSQDQIFSVVRNVVTAAAAIGLGGSVVVAYRKQVTAENAQKTANQGLQATLQGLQLNLQTFERTRETDLRSRYTTAVGLLAEDNNRIKRLAGVSSLVELADDWTDLGNESARDSIIRLLALEASQGSRVGEDPALDAIYSVILERVSPSAEQTRKWSGFKCTLPPPPVEFHMEFDDLPFHGAHFSGIELLPDTDLNFAGVIPESGDIVVSNVSLRGGNLSLNRLEAKRPEVVFRGCELMSGRLGLDFSTIASYKFQTTKFGSVAIEFQCGLDSNVTFEGCHFTSTIDFHSWHFHPNFAEFIDCTFESAESIPRDWPDSKSKGMVRPIVAGKRYDDLAALGRDETLALGPSWDEAHPV